MDENRDGHERDAERSGRVFDPVAGLRTMVDVQAEGLRAAGALLDRMLGSEPDAGAARSRSRSPDYGALVQAWTDLLVRMTAGLTPPGSDGGLTLDVDAPGPGRVLRLRGAAGEVWIRNAGPVDAGPLRLTCGRLEDSEGAAFEGSVRFEPAEIELLPARTSRAVGVSLEAPAAARPGVYRGVVQASGAAALWLPIEVEVARG
jgi:hypothetical protein